MLLCSTVRLLVSTIVVWLTGNSFEEEVPIKEIRKKHKVLVEVERLTEAETRSGGVAMTEVEV